MINDRIRSLRSRVLFLGLVVWFASVPAGVFSREAAQEAKALGQSSLAEGATKKQDSFCTYWLPNLDLVKQRLIAYHDCTCDCGCYADDVARVGNEGLDFLKHYVQSSKKEHSSSGKGPAVVIDIDDTALSNWENMKKMDFTYSFQQLKKWEQEEKAPAIEPTLTLFRFAQENHLATFFVTGRPEEQREITVKDLETAGYHHWTGLIMRQPGPHLLASQFKSAERKKLREAGYQIVLNIGDQESDLVGEPALKNSKLPNPFYYIR